jgi:outer membrane protein OmpA-like peptidoglycan-associated protein
MSAPPSSSPPQRRTGAVRTGEEPGRRRGGLLWLLLGLLALLVLIGLALGLYFGLRGHDKPNTQNAQPPASASSSSGPFGSGGASGSTSAAGSGGAGGLVGGAGVTATMAGSVPDGSRLAVPGTAGTVLFAENSAVVDAQGRQVVSAAVQALRASGAQQVQVTGYTDVIGGQPVNGGLSQQRADAVAALLRSQLGSGAAVSTAARGQADPVVPNDTDAHRQLNRRGTITSR